MNILLVDDEVAVIQILKKAVCWEAVSYTHLDVYKRQVLWVAVAISLLLYKLDKLMPQIKTDNEERRKTIAEKAAGQQEG